MTAKRRGKTTSQKGLGWDHQQTRKHLLAVHVDGTPCAHCKKPMFKWQALDADHELARSQGGTKANRLLHASCNRSRKDGMSPAPALVTSRAERAKWTVLQWV
ncbi:hypothetical protein CH300_00155 [Rhodococcus sp. 15-1154-1]|nr:hypothetical protein [Rhodococcus sp. 15-1154-1]OZF09828.1 hypothetical protein CH300_00155 [Rhodococcus sp. 15-1154-1]